MEMDTPDKQAIVSYALQWMFTRTLFEYSAFGPSLLFPYNHQQQKPCEGILAYDICGKQRKKCQIKEAQPTKSRTITQENVCNVITLLDSKFLIS